MDKALELRKIKEAMEGDTKLPLIKKPEDIIPSDGNPNAKIMFIGEAGGYYESIQRKPFVGAAGQLLTRLLKGIGIEREEVYISNMVKTRPPENRDPLPEELRAFEKYLDQEIEIIEPKVIVTLGRFSMAKFLASARITSVHGKVHRINWNGKEIVLVPMYHPAAALRNTDIMFQIKQDFFKLPKILEEATRKKDEATRKKDNGKQIQLI